MHDKLKPLQVMLERSHLSTVMGQTSANAGLRRHQRGIEFRNDAGFMGVCNALPDGNKTALLRRAAAVSKDIADIGIQNVTNQHLDAICDQVTDGVGTELVDAISVMKSAVLTLDTIQNAATGTTQRFPQARLDAIDLFDRGVALLKSTYSGINKVDVRMLTVQTDLDSKFNEADVLL